MADASAQAHNAGGPPVGLPYGYLWWVVPGKTARPTFMASGFGGQFIWVYPPLDLVVATTSTVSPESSQRGQALHLIRNPVFAAVQRRVAAEPK
ncbi:MAG: serine hydrolase [Acidovorax sp.]|nr:MULTISPECIES: beta-lactamase family protein [unclassified Acidovorax]MDH4419764.1 serine hydrolase [Acidovorax sp.]